MGVSGCGKSTLGAQLAQRLGAAFVEGDRFHPQANVEKMRAGHPLEDADRLPWLDALGQAAAAAARSTASDVAVVACSALKRLYRTRLQAAAGLPVRWICLVGDRALLERRLAARAGHFMPASLLASQLAVFEAPESGEEAIVLDVAAAPEALVQRAAAWCGAN